MLFYKFFFYFIKFYKVFYKISYFYYISISLTWLFSFEVYIYIFNNIFINSMTFELMLIAILILLWIRSKKYYILDEYSFKEDENVFFVTFSFPFIRNCLWRRKYRHTDFQLYIRICSKINWNKTVVYFPANWYK